MEPDIEPPDMSSFVDSSNTLEAGVEPSNLARLSDAKPDVEPIDVCSDTEPDVDPLDSSCIEPDVDPLDASSYIGPDVEPPDISSYIEPDVEPLDLSSSITMRDASDAISMEGRGDVSLDVQGSGQFEASQSFSCPGTSTPTSSKQSPGLPFPQVSPIAPSGTQSPSSFQTPSHTSNTVRGRVRSSPRRKLSHSDPKFSGCCKEECLRKLSPLELEFCNRQIQDKNETQKRQFILDCVWQYCKKTSRGSRIKVFDNFVICGENVCRQAWMKAFKVSDYQMDSCTRLFKKGNKIVRHGNSGTKKMSNKTSDAIGWMSFLFDRIGDFMPHKNQINLPPIYTKLSLYNRMVKEFLQRGVHASNIITYEYFTLIWRVKFPHYKIPKRPEFTICSECTRIQDALNDLPPEHERRKLIDLKRAHEMQVEKERKAYQTHRERARHSPDEVTTLIIDGMDQSKTNLPHFVVHDKDTKGLAKLRVHLTGVLLHSGYVGEKKAYIFRDLRQLPHDSNLTLNCLLRVLHQNKDQLGKSLFLQLDNCFRENKNVYLLSFASLLVELKTFKEVFVHFLPVGHTHEDIDQMFSRIAVRLSKTNALFLDDLDKNISESYSPKIEVEEIKNVFNIKDWIRPCLAGHFGNHSKPHWFWFHTVDGKTVMHYKLWVDDAWRPIRDEPTTSTSVSDSSTAGLICLKEIPDVTRPPAWVIPITERMEPDALLSDIPGKYATRLPSEVCKKWEEFLSNIKKYEEVRGICKGTFLIMVLT